MDKLSMWQLVSLMDTSRTEITTHPKNDRDWMQKFCEDVVEPQFNSKLPEQRALLRSKLFSNSPFSDEPPSPGPSTKKSLSGSRSRHLSLTSAAGLQSGVTTKAPARTRSLSVTCPGKRKRTRSKRRRNTGQGTSMCANPADQHVSCMERERTVDSCGITGGYKGAYCNR
jgi:hypothetical protein